MTRGIETFQRLSHVVSPSSVFNLDSGTNSRLVKELKELEVKTSLVSNADPRIREHRTFTSDLPVFLKPKHGS